MKSFEREARIRRQGEAEGIIKTSRKFGKSEEEILALLQEELQISEEWAKRVVGKVYFIKLTLDTRCLRQI